MRPLTCSGPAGWTEMSSRACVEHFFDPGARAELRIQIETIDQGDQLDPG